MPIEAFGVFISQNKTNAENGSVHESNIFASMPHVSVLLVHCHFTLLFSESSYVGSDCVMKVVLV